MLYKLVTLALFCVSLSGAAVTTDAPRTTDGRGMTTTVACDSSGSGNPCNSASTTTEDVRLVSTEEVRPSTTAEVRPSTTAEVRPSTTAEVRHSTTTTMSSVRFTTTEHARVTDQVRSTTECTGTACNGVVTTSQPQTTEDSTTVTTHDPNDPATTHSDDTQTTKANDGGCTNADGCPTTTEHDDTATTQHDDDEPSTTPCRNSDGTACDDTHHETTEEVDRCTNYNAAGTECEDQWDREDKEDDARDEEEQNHDNKWGYLRVWVQFTVTNGADNRAYLYDAAKSALHCLASEYNFDVSLITNAYVISYGGMCMYNSDALCEQCSARSSTRDECDSYRHEDEGLMTTTSVDSWDENDRENFNGDGFEVNNDDGSFSDTGVVIYEYYLALGLYFSDVDATNDAFSRFSGETMDTFITRFNQCTLDASITDANSAGFGNVQLRYAVVSRADDSTDGSDRGSDAVGFVATAGLATAGAALVFAA